MSAEATAMPRTIEELAAQKNLPLGLAKAFLRLQRALGTPLEVETHRDTIEEALIDEAIRRLGGTDELSRHQNSCACGRWSFCVGDARVCGAANL